MVVDRVWIKGSAGRVFRKSPRGRILLGHHSKKCMGMIHRGRNWSMSLDSSSSVSVLACPVMASRTSHLPSKTDSSAGLRP